MTGCTCGPYWSVIPPPPCPIHDPARRLDWERLQDYYAARGGRTTTTNESTIRAPRDLDAVVTGIGEDIAGIRRWR